MTGAPGPPPSPGETGHPLPPDAPSSPTPPPETGSERRAIAGLEGHWQRLHPLSPVVRTGRGLIPIVVILLIGVNQRGNGGEIEHAGIILVAFVLALISWLVTRWRVEEGVLRVDSGLFREDLGAFPPQPDSGDRRRQTGHGAGVRHVGARASGWPRVAPPPGVSAYLNSHEAEALRSRLLALSHGVAEEALASPERRLLTVPPGRLLASLTLGGTGLTIELIAVALVVLAVLSPRAAGVAFSAVTAWLLFLGLALFRQFNRGYRFTVAEAPDGLRLRSGAVETTAETIRQGASRRSA